uniref:Uncharacterized protein n=1 Tax=Parastrongyloides trichosuri TaxID=131310 RepID=A0A0N4ZNK6_PARTI
MKVPDVKETKRSFASVVSTTILIKQFLKNLKKESEEERMSNFHEDLIFNVQQPSSNNDSHINANQSTDNEINNNQNNATNEIFLEEGKKENFKRKESSYNNNPSQIVRNISDLKIGIESGGVNNSNDKGNNFKNLKKKLK